jgi:hypothetical protein
LPVFIEASSEDPESMRRLQIVDSPFCSGTRFIPGF